LRGVPAASVTHYFLKKLLLIKKLSAPGKLFLRFRIPEFRSTWCYLPPKTEGVCDRNYNQRVFHHSPIKNARFSKFAKDLSENVCHLTHRAVGLAAIYQRRHDVLLCSCDSFQRVELA
jgi:hypothetical protein